MTGEHSRMTARNSRGRARLDGWRQTRAEGHDERHPDGDRTRAPAIGGPPPTPGHDPPEHRQPRTRFPRFRDAVFAVETAYFLTQNKTTSHNIYYDV